MSTQRLGKGLRALIPEVEPTTDGAQEISHVNLQLIQANPFQPRQDFDQEKLEELAQSIKDFGLLEPVILRKRGDIYQLVAGERRVRAARLAGFETVPAILRDYEDVEMMQVALIENLQRENLNPIEEAEGYKSLMDQFDYTQSEVAEAVGKKRSSVANSLRLLNLGEYERKLVESGELSMGHAKVLLSVTDARTRAQFAERTITEGLSVRALELLVKKPKGVPRRTLPKKNPELLALEESLKRQLGTKVSVSYNKGAGRIAIEYYSDEELERLLEMFGRI